MAYDGANLGPEPLITRYIVPLPRLNLIIILRAHLERIHNSKSGTSFDFERKKKQENKRLFFESRVKTRKKRACCPMGKSGCEFYLIVGGGY